MFGYKQYNPLFFYKSGCLTRHTHYTSNIRQLLPHLSYKNLYEQTFFLLWCRPKWTHSCYNQKPKKNYSRYCVLLLCSKACEKKYNLRTMLKLLRMLGLQCMCCYIPCILLLHLRHFAIVCFQEDLYVQLSILFIQCCITLLLSGYPPPFTPVRKQMPWKTTMVFISAIRISGCCNLLYCKKIWIILSGTYPSLPMYKTWRLQPHRGYLPSIYIRLLEVLLYDMSTIYKKNYILCFILVKLLQVCCVLPKAETCYSNTIPYIMHLLFLYYAYFLTFLWNYTLPNLPPLGPRTLQPILWVQTDYAYLPPRKNKFSYNGYNFLLLRPSYTYVFTKIYLQAFTLPYKQYIYNNKYNFYTSECNVTDIFISRLYYLLFIYLRKKRFFRIRGVCLLCFMFLQKSIYLCFVLPPRDLLL
uniref:PEP424R n=1 Tax=African swine fever virus TaxID=10497 RepID=A0A6G7KTR1_ASF